jgi:hypothetical protein
MAEHGRPPLAHGEFVQLGRFESHWYKFGHRSGLFTILGWLDSSAPISKGHLARLYHPKSMRAARRHPNGGE